MGSDQSDRRYLAGLPHWHVQVSNDRLRESCERNGVFPNSALRVERFLFWFVALGAAAYATWWLTIFVLAFMVPHQATGELPIEGEMRRAELTRLKEIALSEYEHGNFVVIGGDWNSVLPGIELDQFPTKGKPGAHMIKLPQDFFPRDWQWGVSLTRPTERLSNCRCLASKPTPGEHRR